MTMVALTGFVRVGAGTWPDLSRHALGVSKLNVHFHIILSLLEMRRSWFISRLKEVFRSAVGVEDGLPLPAGRSSC
jgi:hypothetical protein